MTGVQTCALPISILTVGASAALITSKIVITTGGSGYAVGDSILISGGSGNAQFFVTTIDGSGGITGLSNGGDTGTGYSAALGVDTQAVYPSIGSGCIVKITGTDTFTPGSYADMQDPFFNWPIISITKGGYTYILGKDFTQLISPPYNSKLTPTTGSPLSFSLGDVILAQTL